VTGGAGGNPDAQIGDYALIGDTRTGALCSRQGSIDWLCLPRFDSEPVFGRLVDPASGGWFSITPLGLRSTGRRYRDGSCVLETRWQTGSGEVVLEEGMILDVSGRLLPQALVVRRVECVAGEVEVGVCFAPRQGLPGRDPRVERRAGALVCSWGPLALGLRSAPQLQIVPGQEATVSLRAGSALTFALSVADRTPLVLADPPSAAELLKASDRWWRHWYEGIRYEGPFPEAVQRSLLTLRMLTYAPSGAPVAAPTTSLPEVLGGTRNWDYRYSWPRDASIGLAAFLAVGKDEEAHAFLHWLLHASRLTRPRLGVLYTLYGKTPGAEREADVSGYGGSAPVRVGNAAHDQHQLDVYGWVVDTAWVFASSGRRLHAETWRVVANFADFVAEHWWEPDAGIWEGRDAPAHHVHSKLMGWLALDRALRLAPSYGARRGRLERWARAREAVAEEIRRRGYDEARGAYVRRYDDADLDAALALLPVLEFEPAESPRTAGTVEAIRAELAAGAGLVYRYLPGSDGLEGEEGAFLACSYWLAQALVRLGRVDEALELFHAASRHANDVGLLSEEVDPTSGASLGNFPQALSHAALVQCALALQGATAG
jgi:GH15 family glucan-1,4-alpha-glucosidase